jgi:DNA mismatch repair protein MutS
MSELAYILNTATENSLVILDEIGRGTSTYDGLSIAWAVVEYLTGNKKIRTMFATHYQELTVLEDNLTGFKNLNVDVSETGDDIVFLHKIVEGSASRSYGIHVAKLAGVPKALLENAQIKLNALEDEKQQTTIQLGAFVSEGISRTQPESLTDQESSFPEEDSAGQGQQLSFFEFAPNPIVEELKALDLMEIKPSEALAILEKLKEAAEN